MRDLDRVLDRVPDFDLESFLEYFDDFRGGVESLLRDRVLDFDLYPLLLVLVGEGTVWSGVDSLLLIGLTLADLRRRPLAMSSFFCLIANCFSLLHS